MINSSLFKMALSSEFFPSKMVLFHFLSKMVLFIGFSIKNGAFPCFIKNGAFHWFSHQKTVFRYFPSLPMASDPHRAAPLRLRHPAGRIPRCVARCDGGLEGGGERQQRLRDLLLLTEICRAGVGWKNVWYTVCIVYIWVYIYIYIIVYIYIYIYL